MDGRTPEGRTDKVTYRGTSYCSAQKENWLDVLSLAQLRQSLFSLSFYQLILRKVCKQVINSTINSGQVEDWMTKYRGSTIHAVSNKGQIDQSGIPDIGPKRNTKVPLNTTTTQADSRHSKRLRCGMCSSIKSRNWSLRGLKYMFS